MSIREHGSGRRGLTLVEVLVATLAVGLALTLWLGENSYHGCRSQQTVCINNLRQVGTAFRLWADDNNDFYPMHFTGSTNYPMLNLASSWLGEPRDYADAYIYFVAMSNELSTPKLLVCSQDKRTLATNFSSLRSTNVSYFVGLDAHETNANMLLAGDRNMLVNSNLATRGMARVKITDQVAWSTAIHNESGDVTLADGSAQKLSCGQLQRHLTITGTNLNRLVFP